MRNQERPRLVLSVPEARAWVLSPLSTALPGYQRKWGGKESGFLGGLNKCLVGEGRIAGLGRLGGEQSLGKEATRVPLVVECAEKDWHPGLALGRLVSHWRIKGWVPGN